MLIITNSESEKMTIVKRKIESTKNTPEISLDPEGIIRIKGRSMIGNVLDFSRQIDNWVDRHVCDPADITCVDFNLEYLNTNNLKFYVSMLRKIKTIALKNKKLMINWYYEEGDEDIKEKGEYISSIINVPINFIRISE